MSQLFRVIFCDSGFSSTDQQRQRDKGLIVGPSHWSAAVCTQHVIRPLGFGCEKHSVAPDPPPDMLVRSNTHQAFTHGISSSGNTPGNQKKVIPA